MIADAISSTDHEELDQKRHRIQVEAWKRCATPPRRARTQWSSGDVVIRPRSSPAESEGRPSSTSLSADNTSQSAAEAIVAFSGAVQYSNVRISEVFRESLESLRRAAEEWRQLASLKSDIFRESVQAVTEASEIVSIRKSLRTLVEHLDDSSWNDAKNDRRCELIDKEIEGTLLTSGKCELERLQSQMLAYRRKVAPLPIKEAQELHQELLKKAAAAQED